MAIKNRQFPNVTMLAVNDGAHAVIETGQGYKFLEVTVDGDGKTKIIGKDGKYLNHLKAPVASLDENLLSWTSVDDADSYTILVDGVETVTGINTTSYDLSTIESLIEGSIYGISVKGANSNYKSAKVSNTIVYEKVTIGTLEETSWATIKRVSDSGSAYWSVGDRKSITLSGTLGTVNVDDVTIYLFILGFNHNESIEGKGISFGMAFTDATGGNDIAFVDSNYNTESSSTSAFTMNTTSSNVGGWKNCHMRKDILGATNVANGDADGTEKSNPSANSLMAVIPEVFRSVLSPMTTYTNNIGNAHKQEEDITMTIDYCRLLSEFEVFGSIEYSSSYEQNYQAQYSYYINNGNKIKKRHSDTTSTSVWYLRSPVNNNGISFCETNIYGRPNNNNAKYGSGLSAVFLVAPEASV